MDELVRVTDLKQYFPVAGTFGRRRVVRAVDGLTLSIGRGETLGLVGESGCGKTTAGRTILRLYEPTAGRIEYDGEILFDSGGLPVLGEDGRPLTDERGAPLMSKRTAVRMLPYRRKMQIVFQDPYASLDPRMTVADIVGEPIDIHHLATSRAERDEMVLQMLRRVGLGPEHADRFPHEFSGGQRQRVGIARALAASPGFVVCDEPVSALDVSIQAQIVNMFEELQQELGLTYLFIAHDLAVVRHISDRIGVMYLGQLVELAESDELIFHSVHPYTQALLSAIPVPDPKASRATRRIVLQGDMPSPLDPPPGCRFCTRCPHAQAICTQAQPDLREVSPGHFAACHLV